jgi:hypothetical protein
VADAYLKEDASGRYLLEDGSGVYLLEQNDTQYQTLVGSLTLTGSSPIANLSIQPLNAEFKLVGERPVLGPQTLILRGQSPSLILGILIQPVVGNLAFQSDAGTIQIGTLGPTDTPITPLVGSLLETGIQPVLFLESFLQPAAGTLVETGVVGTIQATDLHTCEPVAGQLRFTGQRPSFGGVTMKRMLLMRVG